eukprot:scaffold3_cov114-Chaetoceros_neogracile.AAC.1
METKSILSTGSVEEAVETIAEAEVELNVQAQKENEVITNAEIQAELQYPMSVSQPDSSAFAPEALPPAFVSAELRDPGLVGYDTVDISIPYDAAARNAYEISSKSLAYPEFKVKYEAAAIELVKSKQDTAATADELDDTIDVSIPYDAAARNAYEISSKSLAYPEFKVKYEGAAIELVKSKQDTATAFLAALQSTKSPTTLDVDGTEYADSVGNEAAIEFNKKEEREILVDKDSSNAASTRKVGEWSASGIRGIREVVTSTESSFLSFTRSKIAETLAAWKQIAARNAYEISSKSIAYPEFKVKYEAAAIKLVNSKQVTAATADELDDTIDVSIPYDAAARNAYEISSKSIAYPEFKVKYEAAAIELVKSKQDTAATADELDDTIDVSIPYDAAARNAYEISSKLIAYPEFKVKYEAAAIEL